MIRAVRELLASPVGPRRGVAIRRDASSGGPRRSAAPTHLHVHLYRRAGDDPFSGASLYACRCGVVRPGM